MDDGTPLVPVMKLCCHCHCGCVEMSLDQLGTILKRAKSGALDEALLAVR
jgi:hypothetical protein